jgi:hypothetical protein
MSLLQSLDRRCWARFASGIIRAQSLGRGSLPRVLLGFLAGDLENNLKLGILWM